MSYEQFDYLTLEHQYNDSTDHMVELRKFLSVVTSNRILRFQKTEIFEEFPLLFKNGELHHDGVISNGKDTAIKPTPIILYSLYKHFAALFNYTLSNDITAIQEFINKIGNYFDNDNNYRNGIIQLLNELTEFLLFLSFFLYKTDLYQHALSLKLNNRSTNEYRFFNTFFELLPLLSLNESQIWFVCRHFGIEIGIPAPGNYDPKWMKVTSFLVEYAKNNRDKGSSLKELILKDVDKTELFPLVTAVCVGIAEVGGLGCQELQTWLDDSKTRKLSLNVFQFISFTNTKDKISLLDKIDAISPVSKEEQSFLPSLFSSLLQKCNAGEALVIQRCKEKIEKFILSDDPNLVKQTINAISFCKCETAFFSDTINKLFITGMWKQEYSPFIDMFFSQHKDTEYFITFLRCYAMQEGFSTQGLKPYESSLFIHKDENPQAVEKGFLLLMIDDEGSVRRFSHQIFFAGFSLNQRASISFDILKFDELSQYKLALTLGTPFHQINLTVPLLSNLLMSPYTSVRSLTLAKLEELIYSFKKDVIDEVEFALPDTFIEKKRIVSQLEIVLNNLVSNLDGKRKVKELDPNFIETNLLRSYMQLYGKKSQVSMHIESQKHKGVYQLAKKVILARGGGWKSHSDNSIRPLQTFGVSWVLPRTMFIRPEAMDYKMNEFFSINWKEIKIEHK